jgi:hypothetical protein
LKSSLIAEFLNPVVTFILLSTNQLDTLLVHQTVPLRGASVILKMEATDSSETWVPIYQTTRRSIPAVSNLETKISIYYMAISK